MAEQNELQLKIGNEEAIKLKPTIVKVISVKIEEVGTKKAKKVICEVKHPDAEQNFHISGVKYENKSQLETSGLWVNKDSKDMIRKGSALAVFMTSVKAESIQDLVGKSINTITDEKGYLAFKAY